MYGADCVISAANTELADKQAVTAEAKRPTLSFAG